MCIYKSSRLVKPTLFTVYLSRNGMVRYLLKIAVEVVTSFITGDVLFGYSSGL